MVGAKNVISIHRIVPLGIAALLLCGAKAAPQSFCERFAPKLNMTPTKVQDRSRGEWKVNLLSGLGPALFGGSVLVSFSVRPLDQSTVEEYRRFEDACSQVAKGAVCRVEGPARLTIGTKKNAVTADAAAGERAVVEMFKTTIFCRAAQ